MKSFKNSHWSKSFQNDPPQWRLLSCWESQNRRSRFSEVRLGEHTKRNSTFHMMHHHTYEFYVRIPHLRKM